MAYFLYLEAIRFYATILEQLRPELQGVAFLVYKDGTVLDCNQLAADQGIRVGMCTSEGKALLHGGLSLPHAEDDYRAGHERVLDICLEYTNGIEIDAQHQMLLDLRDHSLPDDLAEAILARLRSDLGLMAKAALAPCKWMAKVAASMSDVIGMSLGITPIPRLLGSTEEIADWPIEWLSVADLRTRERLAFLGYRTIGSLTRVSTATLRAQFGNEGLLLSNAALGHSVESFCSNFAFESVATRRSFESLLDNTAQVHEVLLAMAAEVSAELIQRDREGNEIWLYLTDGTHCTTVVKRTFVKKMRQHAQIFFALKLMFESAKREEPVQEIRFMMPHLTASNTSQTPLESMASLAQRKHRADHAVRIVRASMGDRAVMPASEMPEPRRKALLRAWNHAAQWR